MRRRRTGCKSCQLKAVWGCWTTFIVMPLLWSISWSIAIIMSSVYDASCCAQCPWARSPIIGSSPPALAAETVVSRIYPDRSVKKHITTRTHPMAALDPRGATATTNPYFDPRKVEKSLRPPRGK